MQTLVALAAASILVIFGAMMNAPTPPAEVVPEPPAPVAFNPPPPPAMEGTPSADNAPSGG
ncbi:MAG: hypothetical protein R3A48_12000 [Polyangiales bacterium]